MAALRHTLGCAVLALESLADRVAIHRTREVIALPFVAAERGHDLHLLFGLDAFGDNCLLERGAKPSDRADDRFRVALAGEVACERLVDLDLVEGKLPQIVDRRI